MKMPMTPTPIRPITTETVVGCVNIWTMNATAKTNTQIR